MAEHPGEPSAHPVVALEANAEQLDRAVRRETGDDPIDVRGLEGLVQLGRSRTNRGFRLHVPNLPRSEPGSANVVLRLYEEAFVSNLGSCTAGSAGFTMTILVDGAPAGGDAGTLVDGTESDRIPFGF